MEGNCIDVAGINTIGLTEKPKTEEEDKDELAKAMELFNLKDKKEKGNKGDN